MRIQQGIKNGPIKVDMPQWGTVGVNSTLTWFNPIVICGADTTRSSSRVFGCSGSYIDRMRSDASQRIREWICRQEYRIFPPDQSALPNHRVRFHFHRHRWPTENEVIFLLSAAPWGLRKRWDLDWRLQALEADQKQNWVRRSAKVASRQTFDFKSLRCFLQTTDNMPPKVFCFILLTGVSSHSNQRKQVDDAPATSTRSTRQSTKATATVKKNTRGSAKNVSASWVTISAARKSTTSWRPRFF